MVWSRERPDYVLTRVWPAFLQLPSARSPAFDQNRASIPSLFQFAIPSYCDPLERKSYHKIALCNRAKLTVDRYTQD